MGNLTVVQVGPKTGAIDQFSYREGTQMPNAEWLQTWTTPKTALFGRVLNSALPQYRELRTLAPIKYLCSDRITI